MVAVSFGGNIFQALDLLLALLTIVPIMLIINIVATTNLNVLTSRVFLRKEDFADFLIQFIYVILLSAGAMFFSIFLQLFPVFPGIISDLFHTTAVGALFVATLLLYRELSALKGSKEEAAA